MNYVICLWLGKFFHYIENHEDNTREVHYVADKIRATLFHSMNIAETFLKSNRIFGTVIKIKIPGKIP